MTLPYFLVDAFAPRPMGGNPAVVVPFELLGESIELGDGTLLDIAREFNQPMAAFVFPPNTEGVRSIRWIHPDGESDFCGHATFAAGHVLFNELGVDANRLEFDTRAGRLIIERAAVSPPPSGRGPGGGAKEPSGTGVPPVSTSSTPLSLTVPAILTMPIDEPRLARALGCEPCQIAKGDLDIFVLVDSQAAIENMKPDWDQLREIDARGIVVTAEGNDDDVDFVSRFIATTPAGYEDAATGSGHAMLTPFWASRLGKHSGLHALQLSRRGGEFWCDLVNDRQVRLTSRAHTYAKGSIAINSAFVPCA